VAEWCVTINQQAKCGVSTYYRGGQGLISDSQSPYACPKKSGWWGMDKVGGVGGKNLARPYSREGCLQGVTAKVETPNRGSSKGGGIVDIEPL